MKSLKYLLVILLLLTNIKFSKAEDTDTSGVFMTLEGELIYMFGNASLTAATIGYHDNKGKEHSYTMKKMKWMIFGNRVWCAFPIRKGDRMYRMQEIIAMNKDYILMTFWQTFNYLYVYDYESNLVVGKIKIWSSKKSNRKAYEEISPFFKSCTELMKKFDANLDSEELLIKDIYADQCEGAPDLMKFLNSFKDKRMEIE